MSHFTRVATQMVVLDYIKQALIELEYPCEDGPIDIRGYMGKKTRVDLKVLTKHRGYDIGFRKAGKTYECVADWYGIHSIKQKDFVQQVTQRYACHAAKIKLAEQGFELVTEEKQKDGRIHLVLRRMA